LKTFILWAGNSMKRNDKRKYIGKFGKTAVLISIVIALWIPGSVASTLSIKSITNADISTQISMSVLQQTGTETTIFTIENPEIDCEVIDAEPFDGHGDNGPYAIFNDVLLGTLGECRSIVEFDISPFSVPQGEIISLATLEVVITAIEVYGLGVNGETPESLAVDGYIGNGIEELSDFQAGDGNTLDTIATPDPQIGQILIFNVTNFVIQVVNAQAQYVGLTIRAETFGGLWVTEGEIYPKLTIETTLEPVADLEASGSLSWTDVKPGIAEEGSFEVFNDGEEGSTLDWEIVDWPDWGEWTFTPANGTNLSPADGPVNIFVNVIAPDESNTEFTGEITIINCDNASDYCIISVIMKTPKTITFSNSIFLRYQHSFPFFRYFLSI
jgi:hypothetical protein